MKGCQLWVGPLIAKGSAEGPGCSASSPAIRVIQCGRLLGVGSVSSGKGKDGGETLWQVPEGKSQSRPLGFYG